MSTSTVSLHGDEVRTYPALELRAVRADGDDPESPYTLLQGAAVPYDTWTNVGWFEEKMTKGTFQKSIREAASRLPLLLWHDNRSFPIGASKSWSERDPHLWGVWDIDPDDPQAQMAADKANKQMLTGMSVGFAEVNRDGAMEYVDAETDEPVERDEWWRLDRPGLVWHEARLLEVSLTPTPAYAGAQVAMVRSSRHRKPADQGKRRGELEHWQRTLEGLRRR